MILTAINVTGPLPLSYKIKLSKLESCSQLFRVISTEILNDQL